MYAEHIGPSCRCQCGLLVGLAIEDTFPTPAQLLSGAAQGCVRARPIEPDMVLHRTASKFHVSNPACQLLDTEFFRVYALAVAVGHEKASIKIVLSCTRTLVTRQSEHDVKLRTRELR